MSTVFISHSSRDKAWADQIHEALCGGGYTSIFLDHHPQNGIHAGAEWEKMLWRKLRQSRGVVVICTSHWLDSPYCIAEAVLARERGKPLFTLVSGDVASGDRIPDFLKGRQFISLAAITMEAAGKRLLHGLAEEGLGKEFPLPDRPYLGLDAFREGDAAVFFGRKEEIGDVVEVLNRRRRHNAKGFVIVLGASGCGKSSLVRAGVLPRLPTVGRSAHAGDRSGRIDWMVAPPFMAGEGLEGLARSLAFASCEAGRRTELDPIREQIRDARGLRSICSDLLNIREVPQSTFLLVLDQLEEVFGTPEGSDARAALRLLLDASVDTAGPVVLGTMRSDFLNAFQRFEGAAERYEKIALDPMQRSRFGEVIEGPANRFGIEIEPGLVQRLTEDTAYDDALPLLSFTLEKLHALCSEQGKLTHDAYHTLGNVSVSVATEAENILKENGYAGLPLRDPRTRDLRRAFFSLAKIGEKDEITGQPALQAQMPASCSAVLKGFVDRRLLVSDSKNGEAVFRVSHEALFRVWNTLADWLDQDRKALAVRRRIEAAAAEWQANNRADSRAWAEARILELVGEIRRSGVSLDDVDHPETVRSFLGPTDPKELETLLGLRAGDTPTEGGGRYGDAWHPPLRHEARASAGVRLALLGDNRPGVGLREDGMPDIELIPIKAGKVTVEIRENPDDSRSAVVERIIREVGPFRIARYPITITQFQAFVQDCCRQGQWQLPGFPVTFPEDYAAPRHLARHSNHPADMVSWWDAVAFCHWLSKDLAFRLPTEFEWQLAATSGDSAYIYPWGAAWDPRDEPWRANTFESGLGRTTAVGMYPAGTSLEGVLDLAGTVWEWCSNSFDDPGRAVPAASRDLRAVRGGSWIQSQGFARSTVRGRYLPSHRGGGVGFRVVCSSASMVSD